MVLESVFPTAAGGGAESQVRTLGMHLPLQGVDVSVIVPMVRHGPQCQHDAVDGIKVHRIRYPKWPVVGATVMLGKLAWQLWRRRRDYTFIHVHIAGNMAAVCSLVAVVLRKPVLVKFTGMTEMVGGVLDSRPSPSVRFRKRAIRRATNFQATSSQIARLLVTSGFPAARVKLIPNAVDIARFMEGDVDPAGRRALRGQTRFMAVYVGRLEAEKDLQLMLRGWALAFEDAQDVSLTLVGDGSLRPWLENFAVTLGISDQVTFAGASNAVERFMSAADVGLLTSRAEGLSNTLLEYMASGLPVIGSRVSGTEDFVAHGRTGWLFDAGDVVAFARCLHAASVLDSGELNTLGRNAREFVSERASIKAVTARLAQLYEPPRISGQS